MSEIGRMETEKRPETTKKRIRKSQIEGII